MKKLLFTFALMLLSFTSNAQTTVKGDMNDDGTLTISDVMMMVDIILGNMPDNQKPSFLTCPDDNHPHIIDLGLPSGTKWACCNVESPVPEGYGGRYAWGETDKKNEFTWSNYIHCDGSSSTCHYLGYSICGTEYDVAHVKWGGSWVMPSKDDFDELTQYCNIEKSAVKGIKGGKFTSKINGSSIFIPAAGHGYKDIKYIPGQYGIYYCDLWTSTKKYSYYTEANRFCYTVQQPGGPNNIWGWGSNTPRFIGASIRPVCK